MIATLASTHLPGLTLACPVPPQLEAAVEYRGEARYFAIYWTPAGDEAMVTDGRITHDGCWFGYQAFVDHPLMLLALTGQRYDLGSSETAASHWLIVDRATRTLALAPRAQAEAFLIQQHPALPSVHLTHDEWAAVVADVTARLQARAAGIDLQARLETQTQIVRAMTTWLNARRPADWQAGVIHQLATAV